MKLLNSTTQVHGVHDYPYYNVVDRSQSYEVVIIQGEMWFIHTCIQIGSNHKKQWTNLISSSAGDR